MIAPTGLPTIYSRAGLGVELYDVVHAEGMSDTPFLLELAAAAEGPVLELACGTGRVLWPIAAAGHEVTGLELSEAMLQRAQAKAADHPVEVQRRARFVRGDMRDFELGSAFGFIFCTFRSFMALLTPADQREALARVRGHLRPRGRFVVDLFDPQIDRLLPRNPYAPRALGTHRHPATGNLVLWESVDHQNDVVDQILQEIWRWTEVDAEGRVLRQELEEITLRWTYRHELRYLLEVCGLRVLQEYADFKKSPPAYGRELILVAEPA
jgi:SAM-dependent methyltransferase